MALSSLPCAPTPPSWRPWRSSPALALTGRQSPPIWAVNTRRCGGEAAASLEAGSRRYGPSTCLRAAWPSNGAEDFSAWLSRIAGLSAQQRREALQALAGMSGEERNPATGDSAQGPAKESKRRGRGKAGYGRFTSKLVKLKSCPMRPARLIKDTTLHRVPSRRHKCAKVYSAVSRAKRASISKNAREKITANALGSLLAANDAWSSTSRTIFSRRVDMSGRALTRAHVNSTALTTLGRIAAAASASR
jgi:hypothetical protein